MKIINARIEEGKLHVVVDTEGEKLPFFTGHTGVSIGVRGGIISGKPATLWERIKVFFARMRWIFSGGKCQVGNKVGNIDIDNVSFCIAPRPGTIFGDGCLLGEDFKETNPSSRKEK